MLEAILPGFILNSFLFKLLLASFLGALIGLERDIHGRAAGLRTHLLVTLGATVFVLLSESIAVSYSEQITDSVARADPSRIAAQIITGIGFLGAGAIIKSGLTVRGLTTAACLWLTAGIGMTIGAGYYDLGIATTVISLFALIILNKFENYYTKDSYRKLEIQTSNDINISNLIGLIKRKYLKIIYLDKERDYDTNTLKVSFTIKLKHKDVTDKLSHAIISDLEESNIKLHKVKWTHH